MREATFTVSPNRQYLGIACPTTPVYIHHMLQRVYSVYYVFCTRCNNLCFQQKATLVSRPMVSDKPRTYRPMTVQNIGLQNAANIDLVARFCPYLRQAYVTIYSTCRNTRESTSLLLLSHYIFIWTSINLAALMWLTELVKHFKLSAA